MSNDNEVAVLKYTLSLACGKTSLMTFEKYGRMSDKTALFQNLVF